MNRIARWTITALALALVAAAPGAALAGGGELALRKSFEVGSGATLTFDSDRGAVRIAGENRSDIEIEVWVEDLDPDEIDDYLELQFEQHAGGLTVRTRFHKRGGWLFGGDDGQVRFEVRVPQRTDLDLDNGSGGVDVHDIDGRVTVDNGSGGVSLAHIRGDVGIDNGSGGIRIDSLEGNLSLDNGSGGVRADDVRGDVKIDNGSGGVRLDGIEGALEVDTSSGGVAVTMVGANAGIVAETSSGGVRIEVPAGWGADLDLSTNSGEIRLEGWRGIEVTDAKRFRGSVGGGGPRVSLSSSSGDVQLIAR